MEAEMEDLRKRTWEVEDKRNRANEISAKLVVEVESLKGLVKVAKDQAKVETKKVASLEAELPTTCCRANQL